MLAAGVTSEALHEFAAAPHWQAIDLLSDVHLSDTMPRTFDAWSAHMLNTPADAIFLLGDLFEVWIGDDSRHQLFERQCADVLMQTTRHKFVAFMAGNRDFLMGSDMLAACGVVALADPTVLLAFDRRTVLSHGDGLCLTDVDYQRFRAMVRRDEWQRGFLAQPIEERQRQARQLRAESEARHGDGDSEVGYHDIDRHTALGWMQSADAPELIHGHTHRPQSERLAPGRTRHVMTDWDCDRAGRAPRAEVLRLTRAGLQRVPPSVSGAD